MSHYVDARPPCSEHEHHPPVCITCCHVDTGRCDCTCHLECPPPFDVDQVHDACGGVE